MIPTFAEAHYELGRLWGLTTGAESENMESADKSLRHYLLAVTDNAKVEYGYNFPTVSGSLS